MKMISWLCSMERKCYNVWKYERNAAKKLKAVTGGLTDGLPGF